VTAANPLARGAVRARRPAVRATLRGMKLAWIFALVAACSSRTGAADRPSSAAPSAGTPAPAGAQPLSFTTADGVTIEGSYWPPTDPATTGCAVFVHQLSSTRAEWAPVIEGLRGRGHLYAIDMRGHGASTRGASGPIDWQTFATEDWRKVADDLAAAVAALQARGARGPCVLVGASIGSSAVILSAGRAPVAGVVLLSPGLAYRGVETVGPAAAVKAPVLIVHSQEDGAVDAVAAIAGALRGAGDQVDVIADPGTAHGMKIVAADVKIRDRVVAFIAAKLGR
jgi:alpha-beta hydrolase superfamily lysophospholipase